MDTPKTLEDRLTELEKRVKKLEEQGNFVAVFDGKDPLYDKAISLISQFEYASASLLQRRLSIGYARAARLLDQLEAEGYVSPATGSKPRKVLKK